MTKNVEALIDRYHDDVVSLGQVCAIEPRCIGGPVAEAAAVEPHHDGTPAAVVEAARPDVDDQAFLGLLAPVRPSRKGAKLGPLTAIGRRLWGAADPVNRAANARPWLRLLRRHEAVAPTRRRAIGNALEGVHAVSRNTTDLA